MNIILITVLTNNYHNDKRTSSVTYINLLLVLANAQENLLYIYKSVLCSWDDQLHQ